MKTRGTTILAACIAGLALASQAAAVVLHTPPMVGGVNGLRCEVKNLGTEPAEVTIEIILTGGTFHVNDITTTIDPLESAAVVGSGSASVCRFTVPSRRKFLGSACVLTGNGCGGAMVAQ